VHLQETTGTRLRTPLRLLLGVALLPVDWLTLEVTAELSGGLDADLDREESLPNSTEIEHNLVQKEAGLDLRLGGEARLSQDYRLRLGLYTQRSHHRGFDKPIFDASAAGDYYYDVLGLNLALGVSSDDCPDAPGGQRSTSYGVNIVRGQGQALGFVVTPEDILQRQPGNAVPTDLDVWEFTAVISGTLEGT